MLVRAFFQSRDVALWRLLPFHRLLSARSDVTYNLHIIGSVSGQQRLDLRGVRWTSLAGVRHSADAEVWILRGWDHLKLIEYAWRARIAGVPTLMWAERPGYSFDRRNLRGRLRASARELLLPLLFRPYSRSTIALGPDRCALEAFRKLGVIKAAAFPYPNPIADRCLTLDPKSSLRENSEASSKECPLLLFVGTFSYRKAIDIIIAACERGWAHGLRFRVRYVGTGEMVPQLRRHVLASGGAAELFPFAQGDDLLKHYADADVVLLPSRYDGWGLPVHEALAAALPVITSQECGAADFVADSNAGLIVPADNIDALEHAIGQFVNMSDVERNAIGQRGRIFAARHTMSAMADQLIGFCRQLSCSQGNPAAGLVAPDSRV